MLENSSSPLPSLSSTMTDSGSIDWDLIQTVDPVFLKSSNGIDSMKLIAQQFLRATTVPIENSTLILKLLQVLQVIIGYLCTSQDHYSELIKKKEMENQKLKEIIENKSQDFIIGVQCPVCNKLFKSIFFLDKHFAKSHQNKLSLWQSIRTPFLINQLPFYNNLFLPDQPKPISAVESEDIQKTLREIQKELKHKHHAKEKHMQQKIEHRISDVENEINKLKTISEPLLQYKAQAQPQSQQPLLIHHQSIPQMLLQTIPIQRNVEIEPKIISNNNDNNANQAKNNSHHSHHKHRTNSHKTQQQPVLTEQATSPFAKVLPQNNVINSDSYNTSSDGLGEDAKYPVLKNNTQSKFENQNINSNTNKEKQNIQNNNDKPRLNDTKPKKKIKKKIKPTIDSNFEKPILNNNQNSNTNQRQAIKNTTQNENISEKNSNKPKTKTNLQDPNQLIAQSQKTSVAQNNDPAPANTETKSVNSKPNFGIIWKSPPVRTPINFVPDSEDSASGDENQGEIEIGIVKRNDYTNINSTNKAITQNGNGNNKNINNIYIESDREISIPVKKNVLISPQNTFSTNQNIPDNSDEFQVRIPNTQTTTTKCVKSFPTQSPITGLNSSIPSISSDMGSPYNVRTRNKSLLQEMTSESDSKPYLAFDKK